MNEYVSFWLKQDSDTLEIFPRWIMSSIKNYCSFAGVCVYTGHCPKQEAPYI